MENAEKERILRDVLADIADHARELLEAFFRHGSDLEYVRDMLSPDGNNACVKLSRLQIALLRFGPGEIPPMWLTEWHTNSMRLAEEIRRLHPEIESLHHTWNAQKSLYDLLTERYIEYERADDYRDEIKAKIKVLRDKYRENSNGFNALLVESRKVLVVRKRVRTSNPETATKRDEKRALLKVICDHYDKAHENGRPLSYADVVRNLMSGSYAARLRGKKVETWANQASAYGKARIRATGKLASRL